MICVNKICLIKYNYVYKTNMLINYDLIAMCIFNFKTIYLYKIYFSYIFVLLDKLSYHFKMSNTTMNMFIPIYLNNFDIVLRFETLNDIHKIIFSLKYGTENPLRY